MLDTLFHNLCPYISTYRQEPPVYMVYETSIAEYLNTADVLKNGYNTDYQS